MIQKKTRQDKTKISGTEQHETRKRFILIAFYSSYTMVSWNFFFIQNKKKYLGFFKKKWNEEKCLVIYYEIFFLKKTNIVSSYNVELISFIFIFFFF